jgi:hypothetical protein
MRFKLLKSILVLTLLFALHANATAGSSYAKIGKQTTKDDRQSRLKDSHAPLDIYAEAPMAVHLPVLKTPPSPGYALLPSADLVAANEVADLRTCNSAAVLIVQYYRQILFPFHIFW